MPVIVRSERGNEAKLMKWGLVPSWASDPSIGNRMINARAETLLEKHRSKTWSRSAGALFPPMVFMNGAAKETAKSQCGFI